MGKPKRRKFSREEDQIILNEVADKGDKLSTWKMLSRRIKGDEKYHDHIRNRYLQNLHGETKKHGKFSLEEDTVILEHVFTGKPRSIRAIDMINFSSFDNMTEVKRGKANMSSRFQKNLKPILLSYHLGQLNSNWKYSFFEYLVTQNYRERKEIPWAKLQSLYPAQTISSLIACINVIEHLQERRNLSFADALKDHLGKIKDGHDYTETQKDYHQKIVDIYCNCTMPEKE